MKMKDWSDVSISRGRLKFASKPTQARKKQGRPITYRFQKEEGLDDTLILDL